MLVGESPAWSSNFVDTKVVPQMQMVKNARKWYICRTVLEPLSFGLVPNGIHLGQGHGGEVAALLDGF